MILFTAGSDRHWAPYAKTMPKEGEAEGPHGEEKEQSIWLGSRSNKEKEHKSDL